MHNYNQFIYFISVLHIQIQSICLFIKLQNDFGLCIRHKYVLEENVILVCKILMIFIIKHSLVRLLEFNLAFIITRKNMSINNAVLVWNIDGSCHSFIYCSESLNARVNKSKKFSKLLNRSSKDDNSSNILVFSRKLTSFEINFWL